MCARACVCVCLCVCVCGISKTPVGGGGQRAPVPCVPPNCRAGRCDRGGKAKEKQNQERYCAKGMISFVFNAFLFSVPTPGGGERA